MKKTFLMMLIVVVISALALVACGGGSQTSSAEVPAPPAEYANKSNPKAGDATAAEAGKQLFKINCAPCHGDTGKGDGPSAAALDPHPKDLSATQKNLSDAYVFWRVSEGGLMAPFNSTMPAWKAIMTEDQIWQIVTFIRTLR